MYALNVDNMDIKLLNPLTLAYMGDAVLDQRRENISFLNYKVSQSIASSFEKLCLRKVRRKL